MLGRKPKADPEITALTARLLKSERAELARLKAEMARHREMQRERPDPGLGPYERDLQANISICRANIRDLS